MEFNFLSILFITLTVILIIVVVVLITKNKRNSGNDHKEKEELINLRDTVSQLNSEHSILEEAKKTFEEKNKKLWSMSEAVHKEKHKVDSQNETLLAEKEKLQLEKSKVDEKIKKLWQQSTAIHKEKEKINLLKIEVEFKHKEIVDSVNYAKRIQEAILPPIEDISEFFKESFVLFKPRDIVSGDFYWFYQKNDIAVIAACDCTGHGVPGALLSFSVNSILHGITDNLNEFNTPANILKKLLERFSEIYIKGQDVKESFAISLVCYDQDSKKIAFSGISQSVSVLSHGEVKEVKSQNSFLVTHKTDFFDQEFLIESGDRIYFYSDGYYDQKNATTNRRMYKSGLHQQIQETKNLPLKQQVEALKNYFMVFKGGAEQIDDVTLFIIEII